MWLCFRFFFGGGGWAARTYSSRFAYRFPFPVPFATLFVSVASRSFVAIVDGPNTAVVPNDEPTKEYFFDDADGNCSLARARARCVCVCVCVCVSCPSATRDLFEILEDKTHFSVDTSFSLCSANSGSLAQTCSLLPNSRLESSATIILVRRTDTVDPAADVYR